MVGGVPIGDAEYVRAVMDQQATKICELIENTATELQSKPHAFWSCLYYSLAPRIDYWLRHMPPRQTIGAAARVDRAGRALLTAAYSLGYDSIFLLRGSAHAAPPPPPRSYARLRHPLASACAVLL